MIAVAAIVGVGVDVGVKLVMVNMSGKLSVELRDLSQCQIWGCDATGLDWDIGKMVEMFNLMWELIFIKCLEVGDCIFVFGMVAGDFGDVRHAEVSDPWLCSERYTTSLRGFKLSRRFSF